MTTAEPKQSLVGRLFAEHRTALQSFFLRRVRTRADAADLAQQVYLRMLRIRGPGAIRNPVPWVCASSTAELPSHRLADLDREGFESDQQATVSENNSVPGIPPKPR
jgi:DNA-directed RNA polymerase specialized sigma24 family protein